MIENGEESVDKKKLENKSIICEKMVGFFKKMDSMILKKTIVFLHFDRKDMKKGSKTILFWEKWLPWFCWEPWF